jgi:hypothetical protein
MRIIICALLAFAVARAAAAQDEPLSGLGLKMTAAGVRNARRCHQTLFFAG